jgi:tRNA-specific 2-thiouridylase
MSIKALALFSGGLDSMIAIKLLTDQGIEVTALHIDIGFGGTKDNSELLKNRAAMVGADLITVNTREQFIQEILFNPKYGYGKHFNPCIDCHANMFRIALALLEKYDASFIITGEVIGQRPMSQRSEAIKNVTKLANQEEDGLILRPMSAKLMTPTIPEKEGWVDREKLLGIEGRSREVQLRLAKEYGFEEYESPGGGCLLTETSMATKIRDVVAHGDFKTEDIDLLKHGRHFRLPDGAKLVMGRNKEDNDYLQNIVHPAYAFVKTVGIVGGLSLLSRDASEADKVLAARLILTYTKAPKESNSTIMIGTETLEVMPFEDKKVAQKYFVLQ